MTPLKSQYHGLRFDEMFQYDDYVAMRGENIEKVFFDEDNYFVGFKFANIPSPDELLDIP